MKNFYKRICALSVVTFIVTSLFALDFSPAEEKMVEDIFSFRLSLRSCKDEDESIGKINDYCLNIKDKIESFSQEAQITCRNLLASSKYNCEYSKDMKSPNMEKILRPSFEEIINYMELQPSKNFNPWFVLSSADVINSMMQFLPQTDSIKYGLQEKKDYAKVIEENPNLSYAYTLSGWWYYYAPAVGGGSKSKAKTFFFDALKNASSDYDRFYSNINYGQFLFEEKKFEECEKYMKEADSVLEGTSYVSFIKKINDLGYSLFDYNMNSRRVKINEKLNGK